MGGVWKLALPHFQASNRTKYSLEVLRLANAVLSPNLTHQVKWNRFINTKGGPGRNIPCDLYNEHMNQRQPCTHGKQFHRGGNGESSEECVYIEQSL